MSSTDFQPIIDKLEQTRQAYHKKNKGRFKRMLLRTWLVWSFGMMIMNYFYGEITTSSIISSSVFALLASLPFAGIAFFIVRGLDRSKFEKVFDQVLVSKVLEEGKLNIKLSSSVEGHKYHMDSSLVASEYLISLDGCFDQRGIVVSICLDAYKESDIQGVYTQLEVKSNIQKPLRFYGKYVIDEIMGRREERRNSIKIRSEQKSPYGSIYNISLSTDTVHYYAYCDSPEEGKTFITEDLEKQINDLFEKYEGKLSVVLSKDHISMAHFRSDAFEILQTDARLKEEVTMQLIPKFRKQLEEMEEMVTDLAAIVT